jgi:hypothetical protein
MTRIIFAEVKIEPNIAVIMLKAWIYREGKSGGVDRARRGRPGDFDPVLSPSGSEISDTRTLLLCRDTGLECGRGASDVARPEGDVESEVCCDGCEIEVAEELGVIGDSDVAVDRGVEI